MDGPDHRMAPITVISAPWRPAKPGRAGSPVFPIHDTLNYIMAAAKLRQYLHPSRRVPSLQDGH